MFKTTPRPTHSTPYIVDIKKDDSIPVPTISVTEITELDDSNTKEDVSTAVSITEIPEPVGESQDEEASSMPSTIDLTATHIKASPYTNVENFLHLDNLALQERLFAHALTTLQPCRPDYAIRPYLESFNWNSVFALLRHLCKQAGITFQRQEFYAVIFLSKRNEDADGVKLGELDQGAHREACESGGLLTYWFGSPNAQRKNLATCEFFMACEI